MQLDAFIQWGERYSFATIYPYGAVYISFQKTLSKFPSYYETYMIIRKVTYFFFHFCLDAKVEQKVKAEDSQHKNNFIYTTFIQTRTQRYSLYS